MVGELNIWTYVGMVIIFLLFLFQYVEKLPQIGSVRKFLELVGSRSGEIIILSLFTMWFFAHSMKLFYYTLDQVQRGTLQENNAYALMGLQFITSTAFGGAFGALLKTMSGEVVNGLSKDKDEKKVDKKEEEKGAS